MVTYIWSDFVQHCLSLWWILNNPVCNINAAFFVLRIRACAVGVYCIAVLWVDFCVVHSTEGQTHQIEKWIGLCIGVPFIAFTRTEEYVWINDMTQVMTSVERRWCQEADVGEVWLFCQWFGFLLLNRILFSRCITGLILLSNVHVLCRHVLIQFNSGCRILYNLLADM